MERDNRIIRNPTASAGYDVLETVGLMPELEGLTPEEGRTYKVLWKFITGGHQPSLEEIAGELGISLKSKSLVDQRLIRLEQKSYIRLGRNAEGRRKARSIELVHWDLTAARRQITTVKIRVEGQIAAGSPIRASENHIDWLELSRGDIGRNDIARLFALDVRGDSMVDEGILDGDRIVVRRLQDGESAVNRDTVVAQFLEQETGETTATVKRYERRAGREWLIPANDRYAPIDVQGSEARIIGKVLLLRRTYP